MRENKKETLYILILKVLKFMFVYWFLDGSEAVIVHN